MNSSERTTATGHARAARSRLAKIQAALSSKTLSDDRARKRAHDLLIELRYNIHHLEALLGQPLPPPVNGTFREMFDKEVIIVLDAADQANSTDCECSHPDTDESGDRCLACGRLLPNTRNLEEPPAKTAVNRIIQGRYPPEVPGFILLSPADCEHTRTTAGRCLDCGELMSEPRTV